MSLKEFVKIAVGLREHPKVLQAGDDGGWLFVCAIMWSKEHDTDGFIPAHAVARLTGLRQPAKVLERCVNAGLFEAVEGGWQIHDYVEIQESSARRKAAGRRAAEVRWERERAMRFACESDANRNAHAVRNRNTEEEEEKEPPQSPPGGKVVKFDRKPVPPGRLELAQRLLADFNEQAGTSYGAFTGNDKPSDSLKRIIGALTQRPDVTEQQAHDAIAWQLDHPFWDGPAHTGVVFGPGVWDKALEATKHQNGRSTLTRAERMASYQGPLA